MSADLPRVTFGMIVLNGEPFLPYSIRALYPFAHEIIIVEGACRGAASLATEDGHSKDATLAIIRRFQSEEDPRGIVQLVTAEDAGHPDGFWPGEKNEQSQAYAERATGELLWQVDSDEFYQPSDMQYLLEILRDNPSIKAVSFPELNFWGGFDTLVDSWHARRGAYIYHRLFRWGKGYSYATHRPPTVLDQNGKNLRDGGHITARELRARGIFLYHYSLVFTDKVREKCTYYQSAEWSKRSGNEKWFEENFLDLKNPYHLHNVFWLPGWLIPFTGTNPPEVEALRIASKSGAIKPRNINDDRIADLKKSFAYRARCLLLSTLEFPDRIMRLFLSTIIRLFTDPRTELWRWKNRLLKNTPGDES